MIRRHTASEEKPADNRTEGTIPGDPLVSIVIPCWNEQKSIGECLGSLLEQTYPKDRVEVLVADGGSTDDTVNLVRQFGAEHPEIDIRVVDNPDRIQSAGCNRAIRASRGDIIVRLDAHARYDREYVANCVRVLRATGADNAGGAARAVHKTFMQRAVATALSSRLAVGGAAYRSSDREGWVDTVWNGAFRRRVFERIGLYDPRAVTNEDAELNFRIAEAGGRVYLSKDIVAYYYPRSSLGGLFRQYFRYGMGRARTTIKHRRLQTFRPLLPLGLVLSLAILASLCPFFAAARVLFALEASVYALALVAESLHLALAHGASLGPPILAIFPAIHLAHGIGFACGLVRYGWRADWTAAAERLTSPTLETVRARDTGFDAA